jgi:MFS family permease
LFGPSKVFKIPVHLGTITAGNALLGISCSFIFVPLLSEIVDAVNEKEGLTEDTDLVNDLASGFFNSSYAIGCLLAPILGGLLNDHYGFQTTCDVMAFCSLTYAIIYFFANMLPYLI